jgi:hypothetical protein
MATLGLSPPYALEDVKQAYRDKARATHPDRGGSAAAFQAVQEAFERAQAYLEFRADRRAWIAAKMNRYAAVQRAVERLRRLGATVEVGAPRWLEQSFGDFAQLAETVSAVQLVDSPRGDELIAALVEHQGSLRELRRLELPGCQTTDDAALRLAAFQQLTTVDLSRTPATRRVAALVDEIESLRTLKLAGTNVGWWTRRRLAARLRRRQASA